MSQTTPPTITAAPTQPVRANRSTFSGLVDAFVTWLIAAVAQFAAVATNVYNNAVDCYNNAVAAAASASSASTSATSAANTATAIAAAAASIAGAAAWVSGTSYVAGDCVYSPINLATYRRRSSGAGTTDPSLDNTNWAPPVPTGFRNIVVLTSTQSWTPPSPDVTRAEITVVDGGYSGAASTNSTINGGPGGNASISIIAVNPSVTYTATVGAGGVGGGAGTTTAPQAGGASSFSGSGITTLTSSNGALKRRGGPPSIISGGGNAQGGDSLYAARADALQTPTDFGQGGPGNGSGSAALNGFAGAVIIRY